MGPASLYTQGPRDPKKSSIMCSGEPRGLNHVPTEVGALSPLVGRGSCAFRHPSVVVSLRHDLHHAGARPPLGDGSRAGGLGPPPAVGASMPAPTLGDGAPCAFRHRTYPAGGTSRNRCRGFSALPIRATMKCRGSAPPCWASAVPSPLWWGEGLHHRLSTSSRIPGHQGGPRPPGP